MYISRLAFVLAALSAASCIDKDVDNTEFYEKYARGFDNRTTVAVNIASEVAGEYYAVYFGNPYDGESLVKQPALTGFTPVSTTLDVPKDVERLYVVAQGEMKSYEVGNLSISAAARPGPQSRAADVNPVSARVMTAVNSIYFPEKTNNVRGDDLFKCTDLVIDRTPSSGDFDEAEIWLTFLGDGGCRHSQLFGKLWFYTYPSSKQDGLTLGDCTFYGVKDGEVVAIPYSEVRAQRSWVFYTREEFSSNIASYKRYKLGVFPKGLNLGFVYIGNSTVSNGGFRFTTLRLNERVQDYTLTYQDDKKTFRIVDRHLANGYICHVTEGDFQGNILGMENRVVTESAKYDGDYNDILCMIESNPRTIAPGEEVEIGNSGSKDPEEIACKTSAGLYLFEDNYPYRGDFDFNDAVVQYEIRDYYQSKNRAKQITVQLMATGSHMSNSFGFRDSKGFQPFLSGLKGYRNVYAAQAFEPVGEPVVQTLYGDVVPCLKNESEYYIYPSSFNTAEYPSVLDIPLSDPDDASWKFEWPQEMQSIDDCYWFLKSASGGSREKDWYKRPKDATLLFGR